MSILKNPIILAIIVTAITYVVLTYFFGESKNDKSEINDKKKTKKDKLPMNKTVMSKETIIIISVVMGLVTWYVTSNYMNDEDVNVDNTENIALVKIKSLNTPGEHFNDIDNVKANRKSIPQISSDDLTRSYNLIGSGLNIPRAELKIPNVLIDYK